MDFGQYVRELRSQSGETQRQVARRARLHVITISKIERGKLTNISVRVLLRLAAGLRETPATLLEAYADASSDDSSEGVDNDGT